jgi:Bacterial Ig-like domain (group 2)
MRAFVKRLAGAAVVMVAAGCGGDRTSEGISPTGPFFVGNTASVTVSCPTQMETGTSGACNAFGYDSNNTYTNSNESSWSSSNTSVATVSSMGAIAAVGTGTTTISAVIDGITGSTSVTVVASTLTASISGPSSVRPNTTCYWWANASGGTSPYSYSWTGGSNGSASGPDYFARSPSGGSFQVTVTVTDANGGTRFVSKTVSISSSALMCMV